MPPSRQSFTSLEHGILEHVAGALGGPERRAVGYFLETRLDEPMVQQAVAPNGAWGLWSTTGDMHLLDRAFYTEDLLGRDSIALMYKPHGDIYDPDQVKYDNGYGWLTSTTSLRKVIRHYSLHPGYQSELRRFVEEEVSVIILSNFQWSAGFWYLSPRLAATRVPELRLGGFQWPRQRQRRRK